MYWKCVASHEDAQKSSLFAEDKENVPAMIIMFTSQVMTLTMIVSINLLSIVY